MPASQLLSLTTALQIIGETSLCEQIHQFTSGLSFRTPMQHELALRHKQHISHHTLLKQNSTQDPCFQCQKSPMYAWKGAVKSWQFWPSQRVEPAWICISYHEFPLWPVFVVEKLLKLPLQHNLLLLSTNGALSVYQTVIVYQVTAKYNRVRGRYYDSQVQEEIKVQRSLKYMIQRLVNFLKDDVLTNEKNLLPTVQKSSLLSPISLCLFILLCLKLKGSDSDPLVQRTLY